MNILIVSGSRADAAALKAVWEKLSESLHNVTWCDVDPKPHDDKPGVVAVSATLALNTIVSKLEATPTDLVILHGDRYEVLAAATGAFLMGVPIAHVSGGDLTEGSQDDSMRHAITKLSHLHFATCKDSARRIIQMGEDPERVHVTGDPGVDSLLDTVLLKRAATLKSVGLPEGKYFVVSYHPNTLGNTNAELDELMSALRLITGVGYVLIDPNKDAGHKQIEQRFKEFSAKRQNVIYCAGLDREIYLSLLKHSAALVGNSSAGFYEAPYLGTPVINIGDRQKGRQRTFGLLPCPIDATSILGCLRLILDAGLTVAPEYPYGNGDASEKIVEILADITNPKTLLKKKFKELDYEAPWLQFPTPSILVGKQAGAYNG